MYTLEEHMRRGSEYCLENNIFNIYFDFQFSNFILVAQGLTCGAQALLTTEHEL